MATTYPASNQFLMAEDEALKQLLTGLAVPGDKPGRKVPVYFRFPEQERQIVFPFITIDLLGIEEANELWTSTHYYDENEVVFEDEFTGEPVKDGLYEPSVDESVFNLGELDLSMPFRRQNYLAYHLYYQVTTWAKTFAHDRVLSGMLIRDIFHPRPAFLKVLADHTWRRMDVLGWQPSDIPIQEGGSKRIFRKAFTLSVAAEIPQDRLAYITQAMEVRRIAMRGFHNERPDEYWTEDQSHILPGDKAWEILHDEDATPPY